MKDQTLISQIKQLKNLEVGGQPRESWVVANRNILLAQINPRGEQRENGNAPFYFQYFNNLLQQKVLRPVMAALVLVAAFLTYDATISAANTSLPGDPLYTVKAASEGVQLALAFSDDQQVELRLDFASRRVDEFQKIASQPDNSPDKAAKLSQTVKGAQSNVQAVSDKLNKISAAFSPSAVAVAREIDSKTMELTKEITLAHNTLSEATKEKVNSDVQAALKTTDTAGADALGVMAKTASDNKNSTQASTDDLVGRVAERIKTTEATIAAMMTSQISATSTLTLATSTGGLTSSTTIFTTQTQQAQQAIASAKNLLDQNNIVSAVEKLKEGLNLTNTAESTTVTGEIKGTSTEIIVK